ncbi:MAG: ABC transporter ATP-binding protein [Planctomycetes bacterium]|nr:ABC transporter ATP-binding protein [Planctomycetota bacterium]
MNAVELFSLTKRFGRRVAVEALDLRVAEGQVFGLLGRNGAGKSTTIKMMLGLVHPDAGVVRLMERDLAAEHDRALEHVGALVERPAFYPYLTGRKNLELLARCGHSAFRQRMESLAERLGIADRLGDRVGTYSQGMRQKLGLVLSLLPDSRLVILDEPTNGLDPHGIREVRRFLQELGRTGDVTLFLSSHWLAEVEQIGTHLAVLELGRVIACGGLKDLLHPGGEVEVRVDRPGEAAKFLEGLGGHRVKSASDGSLRVSLEEMDASELNARLVAAGYRVQELRPRRATLEEYFLNLTESSLDPNLPN